FACARSLFPESSEFNDPGSPLSRGRHTSSFPRKRESSVVRSLIATSLIIVLTALAGCTVGPNYVRPSAPVPTEFKEASGWKIAQPGDELPRGQWWTIFGDNELNALEAQVDVSNQTIQVAEARVRQARAVVQQARAEFFPLVNADASTSRARAAGQ